jgi:hypothetical protein
MPEAYMPPGLHPLLLVGEPERRRGDHSKSIGSNEFAIGDSTRTRRRNFTRLVSLLQ